ncbi:ankyrin repeat domain-containing protein [Legionella gresilensis]|uniref:ankyrin repeat domain-containing protein n=1 Tax=Legionella gresilensis TaxID=91823 RepID=UPI001041702B|nr:ankyrin repeat domain-containing protein [Legionella gresilensis]
MSKLHDIFHEKNSNINRSQAVKDLIQCEKLNINEQDKNGDTILHLMVKDMFDHYYNPYMKGPFYMDGVNYKGPGFLDDLEVLLAMGANPTIKNNDNLTPVDLLFTEPKKGSVVDISDLRDYFILIQKYYPHFSIIIQLIEYGAYRSSDNKKKWPESTWVSPSWLNEILPTAIDERYLSLDCLKELIQWINKGELRKIGTKIETVNEISNRLIKQMNIQISEPFILEVVEKLVNAPRNIILRGMLINDPICPIFNQIEHLNNFDTTNLLTKDLNKEFEALLIEYKQKYKVLNEVKAHPEPLSEEELTLLRPIAATLDNTLNYKIMPKAFKDFNMRSNSSQEQRFMETRWNLFKQNNKHYQKVIEDLKQSKNNI